MYAGHLEFSSPLWWTVDDVLSSSECQAYVDRFEREESHLAPVIRRDGVGIDTQVRNNRRIMWDDADEASDLLVRVRERMTRAGQTLPDSFKGGRLTGANPRLRIYRYQPGERHGVHWDTEVPLDDTAITRITLVVYLNDEFEGGETEFPELGVTVSPTRGRALLFQHRVLHEACAVTRGSKYALRTDVAYQR